MAIKSAAEERRRLRAAERAKRQTEFHAARARTARNGRERLVFACAYVQAVGADLDDAGRYELAAAIAVVAQERSRR